jgi:hypothetical protein
MRALTTKLRHAGDTTMQFGYTVGFMLLLSSVAWEQSASSQHDSETARVQQEIRTLMDELNAAAARRDRAALDRIFARDFIGIHAQGYVEDRETQLDDILTRLPEGTFRLPPFTFEPPNQLLLYGNVALHRIRGKTSQGLSTILTITYAKTDGQWQIVQTQGNELQPTRQVVTLRHDVLDAYVGRYRWTSGGVIDVITREGDVLAARPSVPFISKRRLQPASDTEFVDVAGGEWTFYRSSDGRVTHLIRRWRGGEARADKIE